MKFEMSGLVNDKNDINEIEFWGMMLESLLLKN